VIIGGMLISGDRIIKAVEAIFRERRPRGRSDTGDISGAFGDVAGT
jgi:hypothetical protein